MLHPRPSIVAHQPVSWSDVVLRGEMSSIIHKLTLCMDSRVWIRIRIDLGANNPSSGEKQP